MSRQDYVAMAIEAAQDAGISPEIYVRQIDQESGFNPEALSPAGASGIAQMMPGTAAGLGVDPWDPHASLIAAAQLMRSYLDKYSGDWALALAAYNAGSGAVDQYGGIPPYEETRRYVASILGGESVPIEASAGGGLPVLPVVVGALLILGLLRR